MNNYKALQTEVSPALLVAVSKNQPPEKILEVYNAGCRDFGENRVQEALLKMEEMPKDIRWHLIGTLQKNKVKKIAGKFELIHSVDSIELAKEIEKYCPGQHVLLQVNTSGEESKQGFSVEELMAAWQLLSGLTIKIDGLMTMAPLTEDLRVIEDCFGELQRLGRELGLPQLSMGMSHDYKIAIAKGATMVRIGSALFK